MTLTHRELRQTVHAVLFVAGPDRLLGGRFTVQVVAGQSFHRTHPLPNPRLHLVLVNGQIQVLSLEEGSGVIYAFQSRPEAGRLWGHFLNTGQTNLDRDDAAGLVVVRLARVVPVQRVEPRVGLIAEGFAPHRAEVKVEAVHQEVNFDPGPPGLWTHRRGGARDEGGTVDHAARLILGRRGRGGHRKISGYVSSNR